MRTYLLVGSAVAGLGLALCAGLPLARGDARPATIAVSEIKEGMKGYGLTVFKGTEPERFDVEVIGVLHAFRPGQPLVIVKTPHPRLDVVKTVRGMSGSPIYLDGRLAGAYAYSLSSFELEPVAGVTPIDLMLTEMRRAIPPGFWPLDHAAPLPALARPSSPSAPAPAPHASVDAMGRFDGPPGTYDLEAHAKQLARAPELRASGGITPAATPLMMSGVGERTAAALRAMLEPLGLDPQVGGGGDSNDPGAPRRYVGGGPLGVALVRGDLSIMGLGTTTFADGAGKVAGFGHPMFNGGAEAIPACIGRVLWIDANAQASHKVGECARPLGTLVQDRQSAIVLDENVTAPTVPVDLEITGVNGAPRTKWHAEVTMDKFFAPNMIATVLSSAIEATTSERRELTWHLSGKLAVAGHGTLELDDDGVADDGSAPGMGDMARSRLIATIGDVLNNPWVPTAVTKVEARLDIRYTHEVWRLRGADLLDPIVDAGDKARIRLRLIPDHGAEITRVVEVTLPDELEGKDVEVEIVPGYETNAPNPPPESLEELLANEPHQSLPPRSIVLQYRVPSQGIAYRGHVTARLPPLTMDALQPRTSDSGPEAFPSWSRTVVPMAYFVDGRDKVKIKVRSVMR